MSERVEENSTLYIIYKGGRFLASIEERVENLLEKTINDLGYTLYDVEYAKEAKNYFFKNFHR